MLCYVETVERIERGVPAAWWAAGAGLCIGLVFLTRPLTAVGIVLPYIAHACWLLWKQPAQTFRPLAAMAGVGMACLAFQGWYNLETTENVFLFPYMIHHASNNPGFDHGYTLWLGILKAQAEWQAMNGSLFETYVPFGLLAALAFIPGPRNRWLWMLLATLVSMTVVNLINRFSNFMFGPRYIYELSSALIVIAVAAIWRLPGLLASASRCRHESARAVAACLLAAVVISGWVHRLPPYINRLSHHYVDGNAPFYFSMLAQLESHTPALVFIRSKYDWVAHTNPPRDDAPVIFAHDRGMNSNQELMKYYPRRNAFLERQGRLLPIDRYTFHVSHNPIPKP
jgi:hypothetical protein